MKQKINGAVLKKVLKIRKQIWDVRVGGIENIQKGRKIWRKRWENGNKEKMKKKYTSRGNGNIKDFVKKKKQLKKIEDK